jgi:hypothetical protein
LKKILFVDLDDTLFQTKRKCHEDEELVPMAYLADGSPISYARRSQLSILDMFQREMIVIPTTARNLDAYGRVRMNFISGAILNYGGVILGEDGAPDPFWQERVRGLSVVSLSGLNAYRDFFERESHVHGCPLKVRIISDLGVPFYLVAKSPSGSEEDVGRMANLCRRSFQSANKTEFRVHDNGNNLSVLPEWLDKRFAVRYLIEKFRAQHGEILTLGMGDSLSDIGFLGECHYSVVPATSQIAKTKLVAP